MVCTLLSIGTYMELHYQRCGSTLEYIANISQAWNDILINNTNWSSTSTCANTRNIRGNLATCERHEMKMCNYTFLLSLYVFWNFLNSTFLFFVVMEDSATKKFMGFAVPVVRFLGGMCGGR